MKKLFYLSLLGALSSPLNAWAKDDVDGSISNTVGVLVKNMLNEAWTPVMLLITVGFGVLGVYMLAKGLAKLIEASQDRGGGKGYSSALVWMLMGTLLISLPNVAGVGITSIFESSSRADILGSGGLDYDDTKDGSGYGNGWLSSLIGGASVGQVRNCLKVEEPSVCMARNIAVNAVPIGVLAIFAFVFLAGLVMFALALLDLAKGSDSREGSKGSLGRLVVGVLLMNAPIAFQILAVTIMGADIDNTIDDIGLNTTSGLLSYTPTSSIEIVQRYAKLIGYCFQILVFFGAWAYVRGVMMMGSVAVHGRNAGSYGMASVYMIAGVFMANAKASTCFIVTTVGGTDLGSNVCS